MDAAIARAKAGESSALADLALAAESYTKLLRGHIWKEDNMLFPLADQRLSAEEQSMLVTEFDRVESEVMGEGTHERYHRMLDEL